MRPDDSPGHIDAYADGQLMGTAAIDPITGFRFAGLPAGDKLVELWLPQATPFRLRGLDVDDEAQLQPHQDARKKLVTYGSSITHCVGAASPSETWPAIVARERDLDLTCLGFGGSCLIEPMVAYALREIPADYISLKLGINVYGKGCLSEHNFRSAVIGFIRIVREKQPETPVAVISPIYSPPRETTPNVVGMTLERMRVEGASAVEALQGHGDRNLTYYDGLKLMGPEHADMLPDNLHPGPEGYRVLAQNFLKQVAPTLFRG